MDRLIRLLKLIPVQHRALVAVVAIVCMTNGANHFYHQSGEDEMRTAFEHVSQELLSSSDNCK